ncbi:MAG: hypothetical protein H8E98_05200 [Bacteroidetes bacterium]|nr:hypothetical protein [Bacteroidota bacterium]
MKTKTYLILLIAFVFACSTLKSQNNEKTEDWQQYKELNGVLIYYKYQEYHSEIEGLHQEFLLLKIVNTTNTKHKVMWDIELWYDDKCTTCDKNFYDENHREFILDEGDSFEGSFKKDSNWNLKIFSKFLNYENIPELTKFELTNLIVEPL